MSHPRHPENVADYQGRILTQDLTRRCLECHTTDARSAREQTGPTAKDRSIGCEKCHGPGGHHKAAVEGGLPDLGIGAGLKKMSAAASIDLCGQCHSSRGNPPRRDNPDSVRFQGDTLKWSRCYTESGEGLSCVTCHEPHHNASTDAAVHDVKCLSCHSEDSKSPGLVTGAVASGNRTRKACPVNPKSDCVSCHMPVSRKTSFPHSRFTDHYIRIHRD